MTKHEIKEGVWPEQKYVCPKCHAVVWSSKKPVYCICGGKYETVWEICKEMFRDIFGETK